MARSTVPAMRVQPWPRLVATASQAQQARPRTSAPTAIAIAPAIWFWVAQRAVFAATTRGLLALSAAFLAAEASWAYRPRTGKLSSRSSAVTAKPTYMSLIAVYTFPGTSAAVGFLRPGAYCASASCCPGYEPPCPGYEVGCPG